MKKILKKIVEIITLSLVKKIIIKYNPTIIAITGSIGKTSTKDAIFEVVSSKFDTQKSKDSLNSELGLSLAIAGYEGGIDTSFTFWKGVIQKLRAILKGKEKISKYIILEMGADKPGDIEKLINCATPNISVVTSIKKSHLKFFKTKNGIVQEKRKLVEVLKSNETAILNADDKDVVAMAKKTKANILTYGTDKSSLIKASSVQINCDSKDINKKDFCNMTFKLSYQSNVVPIKINQVIGKPQVYAMLAAAAVGIKLNLNLIEISEALSKYTAPKGRLKILKGISDSLIIDDSYNASTPEAVMAALETLKEIKAKKRIAVIADMLELGKVEKSSHEKIGDKILDYADIILTFGNAAKHIHNKAKEKNNKKTKLIQHFNTKRELITLLKDILEKEIVVLIKGSQGMRMENITKELLKNKKQAKKLLPRQTNEWIKKQ